MLPLLDLMSYVPSCIDLFANLFTLRTLFCDGEKRNQNSSNYTILGFQPI